MPHTMDQKRPETSVVSSANFAPVNTPAPRSDFLKVENFNFYYGKKQALYGINMEIRNVR